MTMRLRALCVLLLFAPATLRAADDTDRVAALIGLARVKRDAGDAGAARRYFEEARRIRALPPDELAEYFWVLASLNTPDALTAGRDVLAARPGRADVRDRTIAVAAALHDEALAATLAADGRRLEPRSALWPRRRGDSLLRQGRPADAAGAFADAVQAPDGRDVRDRAALAVALDAAGRHAQSLAAWKGVPDAIRMERPAWIRSRLDALAYAAPAATAAPELSAWLVAHPDDEPMRAALVDVWARSGDPMRAIDALTPLLAGPSADQWAARAIDLARSAGTPEVAVTRLAARAARPDAPAAEKWAFATLLVESHEYARAVAFAESLSPARTGCDDRLLTLLDRVPGAAGTDALLSAIDARGCTDAPRWLTRGIERAVADRRHAEALSLVHRLPAAEAASPAMERLDGQLLLWTGHPVDAAARLEAVLAADPRDAAARRALVDAYRTSGVTAAAWTAAEPLLRLETVSPDERVSLAALALTASRPDDALAAVGGLDTATNPAAAAIVGRARLLQGRPAEARRVLSAIDPAALDADGALALIDSVSATAGAHAATTAARRFTGTTADWREVIARRVVLEALAGDRPSSAALRTTLAAIDGPLATIADVETALGEERPHDALALLDTLASVPASSPRALDLRATALDGLGDHAGAAALLSKLMVLEPTRASFAIRAALVQWRLHPGDDTMAVVLALPARWPGHEDARVAAATTLASAGRWPEALGVFGPSTGWTGLSTPARVLIARSLQGLGRSAEALDVIDGLPDLLAGDAVLRARIVAAARGSSAANAAFRDVAGRADATPDVYLSWAAVAATAPERLDVLRAGAARFADNVPVLSALAAGEWAAGRGAAASAAADRAVTADPHAGAAWFVLVDAAGAASPAALDRALARFDRVTAGDAPLRIGMAEHVMGVGRDAAAGLAARALSWLDEVPAAHPLAGARDLARVRVLAAAKRWPEALTAADAIVAGDPSSAAALKLRADVLSWSGRHDEAIAAYDVYLRIAAGDLAARRQQARVATWAGHAAQARGLYAAAIAVAPGDAALAAEARAKDAFMSARWDAAVEAYRAWLVLEPGETEARFELAEALRAAARPAEADAELARLVATSGHQLAFAAERRDAALRAPSFSFVDERRHANGYGGQRLLDVARQGGGFASALGPAGRATVGVEGARLDAGSGGSARTGATAAVTLTARLSPRVSLDGRVAAWTLGPSPRGLALWQGEAAWRPADRWTMNGGVAREAVLESLATIDARLTAGGPFASVGFESPAASLDVRGTWQSLSDGNARRRASATFTHVLGDRLRQVRAVLWAEALAYRDRTDRYFAPSGFLRADAGLEYTHAFTTPRFRGDRQNQVAVGYLLGTDNRGTRYQHPTVRLELELRNGLAFDARGSLIRSATYNESAFTVGLRLVGFGADKR